MRSLPALCSSLLLAGAPAAAGRVPAERVAVVAEGTPVAVIVTADRPGRVAEYAAQELVFHVEKATGARLPVVAEGALPADTRSRIYVGDCRATRAAGIAVDALAPETAVLKTAGEALFIAGEDGTGDPLSMETRAGTLWGVYEWLEQALKVRWLWPGELGTYVPGTGAVTAGEWDHTVSPRFLQRKLRFGPGMEGPVTPLGFTAEGRERYARDQQVYLRRHRMGRSRPLSYGHAFVDWWERYGQEHPEWFQLLEDGRRGPSKKGARFSMCVSNPGLHRQIIALWKQARARRRGVAPVVNACENDILGLCICSACKAWDGPAPRDFTDFYSPDSKVFGSQFVSDRYARFWLTLQQLAAREDPEGIVVGYVYFNYFVAPTSGIRLNPNVWLGFCPSGGWFPRTAEEHAWMKRQWTGWAQTGARLFSRTNHFLDGYCMPHLFAHQFADDFQHAVGSGIIATDFDSLTGQWSTQGPNLYLLARLHARPGAPADALLAEYYAAFGPAASHVKAYFDYWEKYTTENGQRISRLMVERQASRWRTYSRAAHEAFPPAAFPPGEAILKKAGEAAATDQEAAARVEFLRKGLEHAKLCGKVAAQVTAAGPEAPPEVAKKALDELIAYRRKTERDGIANFSALAWGEAESWRLPEGYR